MPDSIQESFFRHNLRIFKALVGENRWPQLNQQKFIHRIDDMIEKCTERGRKVYSPAPSAFNVLNHGDFVIRNQLFRAASDGKICDVQFVSNEMASPTATNYCSCSSKKASLCLLLLSVFRFQNTRIEKKCYSSSIFAYKLHKC